MPMFVLLPTTQAKAARRRGLRRIAGIFLFCGSVVGAAFAVMPARADNEERALHRATIERRAHPSGVAPASAEFAALTDSLADVVADLSKLPSILPTVGRISSQFALRRLHPIFHFARPHDGIDIAAPMGAPVLAPSAGIVIKSAISPGYGLFLEIDHGRSVITRYGHLSRILVRVGDAVTRGQLVAKVGNSGITTGPHLHYEIRVGGDVVDPLSFEP